MNPSGETTTSTGRKYQVHHPVGRGGFGTVYRADMLGENGFTRAVALKVLNTDVADSGEVASRFRDEARVLGMLRHRAIVQVDGLVSLGERQALVMEYIEGADLARLMADGPIPAGAAIEIVGEVANALDVAFYTPGPDGRPLGLLHRDIKPSNIRITPAGEVKVLDFGVARAEFDDREAKTKSYLMGSSGYMAPERYESEDGPATDIYSLGVLLLEMLTGTAFGQTSIRPAKLAARVEEALAGVPALPASVQDLIRNMMAFEPADRPSAADIERRSWEVRRDIDGDRLRDWARVSVLQAAARPIGTLNDDLSGRMLVESHSESNPTPPAAEVPRTFRITSEADDAFAATLQNMHEPPAPDEWEEERPTVVVSAAASGASKNLFQLSAPKTPVLPAAPATPVPPPPPIPTVASPDATPAPPSVSNTPLRPSSNAEGVSGGSSLVGAQPRKPARMAAPPPTPAPAPRNTFLAAGIGAGLALLVGVAAVLALQPKRSPPPPPVAVEEVSPPAVEAQGPQATATEGLVQVTGDALSVRFVALDGRRHPEGLLRPGSYLVAADFGQGAASAGRVEVQANQVVRVDCSVSARSCAVYRD